MAAPEIAYRREFAFDVVPEQLWDAVEQTERFESWWPWLRELRIDGGGLVAGAVLHGLVVPPLPYRMRVDVLLVRCRRPESIDAEVHGDLEGTASLRLRAAGGGTRAEVSWRIEMMQRPMRVASRVALPLLRLGHDAVVEMTVAGFRRHLRHAARGSGSLAAPAGAWGRSSMFDKLLVAVDSSDHSDKAVRMALELAKLAGGSVKLVHVREVLDVVGKSAGEFDLEERGDVEHLLAKDAAVFEEGGVPVVTEVRHARLGHAAEEIVEAARGEGAGVIVMGSRGRGELGALVFGSTAYKVLHLADRPVLVAR